MTTIRIKSTDEASQGPFVVINESDFDADKHELFDAPTADPAAPAKPGIADLRAALTTRGIEFDPAAKKADLQVLLDAAPASA
jgi:hypothetical protein